LQLSAGDCHTLVVWDRGAFATLSDTQAVNRELGLCSNTFVQVGGAALDVDLGFLWQVRDGLACSKTVLACDHSGL